MKKNNGLQYLILHIHFTSIKSYIPHVISSSHFGSCDTCCTLSPHFLMDLSLCHSSSKVFLAPISSHKIQCNKSKIQSTLKNMQSTEFPHYSSSNDVVVGSQAPHSWLNSPQHHPTENILILSPMQPWPMEQEKKSIGSLHILSLSLRNMSEHQMPQLFFFQWCLCWLSSTLFLVQFPSAPPHPLSISHVLSHSLMLSLSLSLMLSSILSCSLSLMLSLPLSLSPTPTATPSPSHTLSLLHALSLSLSVSLFIIHMHIRVEWRNILVL